jgi:hypothetical protein
MSKERGRILAEYRRSNASGIHHSTKPRQQIEREALDRELQEANMSILLFPGDPFDVDLYQDFVEPTEQDLMDIEMDDEEWIIDMLLGGPDYDDSDRIWDSGSDYDPEPYPEWDDEYGDDEYDFNS